MKNFGRVRLMGILVGLMAVVARGAECFVIEVVDASTGRGVPLVELKTVSNVSYWTDSNGLVAIDDPELMNQKVYFSVASHGYEHQADGFGFRGTALEVKAGGEAKLKLKRLNIAERLYRVTGAGIYRDTVMAGRKAPTSRPVINAQVCGQDSAQAAVYRGKLYWFWGDTNRQSYPLGHFGTAGAVSDLPGKGGLAPAVGVNLEYFADKNGFSRPMLNVPGDGMKWMDGLTVVKDENGVERLVGSYGRMKSLNECQERGLGVFDDAAGRFETVAKYPVDGRVRPIGQAFAVTEGGVEYRYFATVYPVLRVRADLKSISTPAAYEAWTCLKAGGRFDKNNPPLERGQDGKLVWGWTLNTDPIGLSEQEALVKAKKIQAEEAWFDMRDAQTAKPVRMQYGSVYWNAFRKRYVMIASELGGKSSMLGETWYSEAEKPEGPWRRARKIITHDRYSFYNPVQHPFFDEAGGKVIYLEGTYSTTFSRDNDPTPRYDYNQIMYRLDLSDSRLSLEQGAP